MTSYNYSSNNKFKILVYFVICITALLAACQQTPDKEVIVNKSNSKLDELVLEKADLGDEWTQTDNRIVWSEAKKVNTEIGECNVAVNMDVKMPVYPGPVPVFIIEPKEFGTDFLKKTAEYLLKEDIFDWKASKQDLMSQILKFKEEVSTHTILDQYKSEIEDTLKHLEEKYNNAPNSNNEAKYQFITNESNQNGLGVKSYMADNSIMKFTALADDTGKCYSFFFRINEFYKSFRYLNELSDENLKANSTKTTYEQALTIASEAIEALFKEPFTLVHANVIDKINDLEYLWNDGELASLGQAYVLCYTRQYDDVPSLYIDPASTFITEKTEYAKPYVREYIQVVVDDRGIVEMSYESFSETIEKLNDNVKLMPFEKVLERFKNDVFYHSLWGNSAELAITQIAFGMVREPLKDNPNQYMMVPAWNFIGDVKTESVEENEKSILVLSAIDGSIITDYDSICDPK